MYLYVCPAIHPVVQPGQAFGCSRIVCSRTLAIPKYGMFIGGGVGGGIPSSRVTDVSRRIWLFAALAECGRASELARVSEIALRQ